MDHLDPVEVRHVDVHQDDVRPEGRGELERRAAGAGLADDLTTGTLDVEVLYTPGHTPACVSYKIGAHVFVGEGRVELDDVSFRYPGSNVPALDKASFTIKGNTVVGIVGRSGSGKSTLTKILQGLYPVSDGIVLAARVRLGAVVGLLAGILGGVSSLTGPVTLTYLMALRLDRETFVSSISTIYFIAALPLYGALMWYDRMTQVDLMLSIVGLVPMAVYFTSLMRGRSSCRRRRRAPPCSPTGSTARTGCPSTAHA